VETDRGATFVAGVSEIAEPPLNDFGRFREEGLLAGFRRGPACFQKINATGHYTLANSGFFCRPFETVGQPLVTGEDGRRVVELFTAVYRSNKRKAADRFPLAAVNVSAERWGTVTSPERKRRAGQ